jgi:putative aldouronate transport system substrate-binding protein
MFKVPPVGNPVSALNGKVVSAYDSPELEAALAFAYKMAKSGFVHPDALAGKDGDGKQRFYSGKVLMASDGPGAWNSQDAVAGKTASPKYVRGGLPLFSADGSTPTIALSASAGILSYLNKNLSPAQIDEGLSIANYLAAPYGSAEYTLLNYGVEGVHWTREATGPAYTTQGTKESNQVTYQFLASYRNIVTNPGYADVTQAAHTAAVDAVKHAYKPPFWNMNVNPPSRFSSTSTGTQVNDIIKEVTYGRKTVAEFKAAAANWKSAGGQQLLDWNQKEVADKFGTGQE